MSSALSTTRPDALDLLRAIAQAPEDADLAEQFLTIAARVCDDTAPLVVAHLGLDTDCWLVDVETLALDAAFDILAEVISGDLDVSGLFSLTALVAIRTTTSVAQKVESSRDLLSLHESLRTRTLR